MNIFEKLKNGEPIDLMILHHSQPSNDVDVYQAMERAVEAGNICISGLPTNSTSSKTMMSGTLR